MGLFVFINALNVAVAVLLNALVDRLVKQQRNIRLLLDSASNGFLLVDGEGRIKLANAAVEKLFGYKADELAGKDIEALVPADRVEAHRAERIRYQAKPEARLMGAGRDLSARRRDGSDFPVEIGLNPIDGEGQPAILATVVDISTRKKAEGVQHLVMQELQHRMRNALAVVQAIAENTLREAPTLEQAREDLFGRIGALSHAYSLAVSDSDLVSLARIIGRQVGAHGARVAVKGCDVLVPARIAQQFSLVVHELTTNAVKYGALSGPAGQVFINGETKDATFHFTWAEHGGPPVQPPTRAGFGSVVLRQSMAEFAQEPGIHYRPEGLLYELEIALSVGPAMAGDRKAAS